jgi:hypothetical protein
VLTCPDCDEPLAFTYLDTSGVGAHKRGDNYNVVPDTRHYVCFPCEKAWKQRLDGPLTPDIVGDLAFFTCRESECGRRLTVRVDGPTVTDVELGCEGGHRFLVRSDGHDGLLIEPRPQG